MNGSSDCRTIRILWYLKLNLNVFSEISLQSAYINLQFRTITSTSHSHSHSFGTETLELSILRSQEKLFRFLQVVAETEKP